MRQPGAKAFVVYKKKVLLILRDSKRDTISPNTWNLPGGTIEKGETPLQCLNREISEELNIAPKNIFFLGQQTYEDGSLVFRYLIHLTEDEFENIRLGDEGTRLRFFSINQMGKIKLTRYLDWYFSKYFNQIKELIQEGKQIKPEVMGLIYLKSGI